MSTPQSPAAPPRHRSLAQWLRWQRGLHPQEIDLGLDRVREVLQRLGLAQPAYPVITVAGTNGKGSTVAFLTAMLQAGGYRVGGYTSPHLLRYNERIKINAVEVSDRALCAAFSDVDHARGDISLSFFEFGTLAAMRVFAQADLDVGVLEVGLGGRLDAVNALDAEAAIITTIALDHTDWLGPDRDSIGFEKAGVLRRDQIAVCADPNPPATLLAHARSVGARLWRCGEHYRYQRDDEHWVWSDGDGELGPLPLPALAGDHQLANAAAAIAVLRRLREQLPLPQQALADGLLGAEHPGRMQTIAAPLESEDGTEWVVDVGHNPQGAAALAAGLRQRPVSGRTLVVIGMLRDKDSLGFVHALQHEHGIAHWYTMTISGERGLSAAQLAHRLRQAGVAADAISVCNSARAACAAAAKAASATDRVDRIVICGSLYAVAKVLRTYLLGG